VTNLSTQQNLPKKFQTWAQYGNDTLYQGEVDQHNLPDGRGIVIIPNQSVCFGHFTANKKNGKSFGVYKDGVTEKGNHVNDERHGVFAFGGENATT